MTTPLRIGNTFTGDGYDVPPELAHQLNTEEAARRRSPERTKFLRDLLITAVEGGINYWAQVEDYDPVAGTVTVFESEEVDEITGDYPDNYDPHKVTLDTIAHGIQVLTTGENKGARFGVDKDYWAQFLEANRTNGEDGDHDADHADIILQAGIFGRIEYS